MSIAYPCEMGTLLSAMKQAVLVAPSFNYANDARIRSGPWYVQPYAAYTIYLQPLGSPETVLAEDGGQITAGSIGQGITKYAVHQVMVDAVMLIDNPDDEDSVIGRTDAKVGITSFVSDLLAFFENNFLGLESAGLELGVPPTIECPSNGYAVVAADEDIWLQSARMLYQARTRPFYRTGT